MTRELAAGADHEERLNAVLLAYLEELEAGQTPDRQRLLAAHADLRDDLESFFLDRDEIDRLAAPLRAASGSGITQDAPDPDISWAHEPQRETAVDSDGIHSTSDLGRIGDFRILREIGRGGMGVVYEAQQISLRRRVALKVLPFAAAIDPRQIQRFKNEALAAAHLQHPNIVPVHAVGCERGVHFYAMQFIEGQSLSELIGDLRHMDSDKYRQSRTTLSYQEPDSETTEITARLSRSPLEDASHQTVSSLTLTRSTGTRGYFATVARLVRQAALALEYAHLTGIVHRDIKPSNLLLDPLGQLWVTDFGLAQIGGDAGLTATGELLGTLRYSSPEQALARRGIVDHRSDIYSLGATLYELLTLRPVFEGRDRRELLRQIADDEPPAPRALDPAIPEDLETIVLKALRKEPVDRYATAEELADDLQRFLDSRPILARRPTHVERLRKWGRRHPSILVASIVVLVLISVGSLIAAALIRVEQGRTNLAQVAAQAAYERERIRAEEAESRFRLARRSVDELITFSEEELAHRPGMDGLRKRLLTTALANYQEFVKQRHDDPLAQAELVDTQKRIEGILSDLAVLRASRHMYLLAQPSVLDDLCQDAEQRTKIQSLAAQIGKRWFNSLRDFRRLSPTERGKQTLQHARINEAEVNAVLSPTQRQRVQEIALQLDGSGAFREPDVVTELQLTNYQRERIREIEEQAAVERSWTVPPTGSAAQQLTNRQPPRRPTAMDRIRELLTEQQRGRWKELIGKPFKGHVGPLVPFANPKVQKRT